MNNLESEVIGKGKIQGNSTRVKVSCTKKVAYTFARIFGFKDTTVSAYAVAENSLWAGDTLPFINLNGVVLDTTKGITFAFAWEKVRPGDKERIYNSDLVVSPDNTSIKVKYEDGSITFKKGKDMSKIRITFDNMLVVGKTVYLFSIKESEIDNYKKGAEKELKN